MAQDCFAGGEETETPGAGSGGLKPTPVPLYRSFDDMPLNQQLLRGIYGHGFEKPSAIQQRAIVPMVEGTDIIAQAQAGTGKTGAFSIGLLQQLDLRPTSGNGARLQALVLAPTRELAQQTAEVVTAIGEHLADHLGFPLCQLVTGGTRVSDDVKRLQPGVAVVVGTPGRVADLIRRGALRVEHLRVIVLDEADEMLSAGFADQVYGIFSFVPRDVQLALFSATMPDDVLALAKNVMRDPTVILLKRDKLTLDDVKQYYVAVQEEEKLLTLMDLYESISVAQSVVFANQRAKVDWISQQLNANGHTVASLHAEMSKAERAQVMQLFKSGAARVLVTSDLVARGIDVQHVNVVVNFDLPRDVDNYLHRVGRCGRFGKKGVAINLVSNRDVPLLRGIEKHYAITIDELPMDFGDYLV